MHAHALAHAGGLVPVHGADRRADRVGLGQHGPRGRGPSHGQGSGHLAAVLTPRQHRREALDRRNQPAMSGKGSVPLATACCFVVAGPPCGPWLWCNRTGPRGQRRPLSASRACPTLPASVGGPDQRQPGLVRPRAVPDPGVAHRRLVPCRSLAPPWVGGTLVARNRVFPPRWPRGGVDAIFGNGKGPGPLWRTCAGPSIAAVRRSPGILRAPRGLPGSAPGMGLAVLEPCR